MIGDVRLIQEYLGERSIQVYLGVRYSCVFKSSHVHYCCIKYCGLKYDILKD